MTANSTHPEQAERVLAAYLRWAPDLFARVFPIKAHCLHSCRITLDALRHFGISAEPESVRASVFNDIWFAKFMEAGGVPRSNELARRWGADGARCYRIGGCSASGPEWPGHLVIRTGNHVIDPAMGQFSIPDDGIVMPPAGFLTLDSERCRTFEEGGVIPTQGIRGWYAIERQRHDTSYLSRRGFAQRADHQRITDILVALIAEDLERGEGGGAAMSRVGRGTSGPRRRRRGH